MSANSDVKTLPVAQSKKPARQKGSQTSYVSLFILFVSALFLVTGLAVFAVTYNFQGDSVSRVLGMALGLTSVAASIGLPVITARQFSGMRKRQLCVEDAMQSVRLGDLARRVETNGANSNESLAIAFNSMVSSLEESTKIVRHERNRFHSIHQGITDGIIVFDTDGNVVSANPAAEAAIGLLEKQICGSGNLGITEIEQCVNAADIVPDELKVKCWLAKTCKHQDCPSYESDDLRCWLQCGTYCHDEIQDTFLQKRDACERCDVYLRNGIRAMEYEHAGCNYSVTVSPILNGDGFEEGRMVLFHDISALVSAGDSLKRRNVELTVLNDVGSMLSESFDDIEVVLEEALSRVAHAMGVSAGVILLKQENNKALRLAAQMGISLQASLFIRLLNLSDQLDEFLDARTGLMDVEAFFRRNQSALLMIEREGFRKSVVVPIIAKGEVLGVLVLMDTVKEEYSEADIRMLKSLAVQIGIAVQNQSYFHSIVNAKKAWETTFNSMTDGVSVHDTQFKIVHANRAMAKMLGTTKAELVGSTCYKSIHHSRVPHVRCPQKEVINSGKSVSIEVEDSALKKFFRLSVSPIFGSDNEVVGLVHVMRDITERRLLREQLLQSEKMAAVGKLVSGVAHELNNPLTGVIGYAQLMLRKTEDDRWAPSPNDIRTILTEAERASKIVQNLISFSRKYHPQKSLIDINMAMRTVLDLRAYEMTINNIVVRTDLDPDLPKTMADLHQMQQVFLNMLNNSVHAIADSGRGGVINISSSAEREKIVMSITDNGDGISSEDQGHIFDPFFTTREVGKGAGLGLSICYGIIEDHGGNIRVESSKGTGTTMRVELPTVECKPEAPADGEGKNAAAYRKGPA